MTRTAFHLAFAGACTIAVITACGSDYGESTTPSDGGADGTTPLGTDGGGDAYVDPGIRCGSSKHCDPKTNVCCAPFHGDLGQAFADGENSCIAPTTCSGLGIECDSTLDCVNAGRPNTFCCVRYGPPGAYSKIASVRCRTTAECGLLDASTTDPPDILCDRFAPDPCPPGTTCQSHPKVQGFDVCRP